MPVLKTLEMGVPAQVRSRYIEDFNATGKNFDYLLGTRGGRMAWMKIRLLLVLSLFTVIAFWNGCVTATTIDEAKDHVTYKSKWANGVIIGSEVDTVRKGKSGYYALLPLTVPADIVIYPLWCLWGWGRLAVGLPPD